MEPDLTPDVVFAYSIYSVLLWLVIFTLLTVLYVYARPIRGLVRSTDPTQSRRVCARSAFFLAVFNLSPVMASVLGLPVGTVLIFVPAFIALGVFLRRGTARWPVVVFLALVGAHSVLDLSFFVAAYDYAGAFEGLVDLLLFRGHADPMNAVHVFTLLPADVALLFHTTKTAMDLTALVPAVMAFQRP